MSAQSNDGNDKTHDIWNGEAGKDWAENQRDLDDFLRDAMNQLLAQLPLQPGLRALEIGSGSGTMSMDMARIAGETGYVLGLDVSKELLALARRRAEAAKMHNVAFRDLDIQTQTLDETGFDICAAQFGMMFFSDPVLALGNIRAHLNQGATVAFNGWADEGNPWFSIPLKIAETYLGPLEQEPNDGAPAPGPLAFSDVSYVTELLTKAGYADIRGWRSEIMIRHPNGLEALMHSIRYVGPISTLYRLTSPDEATREKIARDIRKEFAQFVQPDGSVAVPGRVSMYRCLAP
ncbi:class I SAM-dependent methyltransferase [Primorskyibacter aestuariivivens]|uniref:class I SAM-dependent methyltransferase n=1 Tax=Primorskyibacter aestuariivivens TaxID=1888912 RepID=UPI002301DC13|nr:class I SAM-dependent methyltransferase [Primorskyibacter aestuariivivens]MDA7429282.1 class I SAM-dependent methyltransferase [Primorskyibacter aestuariivivens]